MAQGFWCKDFETAALFHPHHDVLYPNPAKCTIARCSRLSLWLLAALTLTSRYRPTTKEFPQQGKKTTGNLKGQQNYNKLFFRSSEIGSAKSVCLTQTPLSNYPLVPPTFWPDLPPQSFRTLVPGRVTMLTQENTQTKIKFKNLSISTRVAVFRNPQCSITLHVLQTQMALSFHSL